MRQYKYIIMILIVMLVFTMFLVPIENGLFPAWMDQELIQFLLLLLITVCVVSMI